MAHNQQNWQFTPIHPTTERAVEYTNDNRQTETRIRIRIPQKYHQEPVISRLISDCGLSVNVKAALLGANGENDGWFDLELQGTNHQIQQAFIYLDTREVEIWSKSSDPDEENW